MTRTAPGRFVTIIVALLLVGPATPRPAAAQDSSLKEPVKFSARDSLIVALTDTVTGDVGRLFGQAKVAYQEASLGAWRIDIRFSDDELHASGVPDDTTGRPVFVQGEDRFSGSELAFNLKSERGRVVGAKTTIEDGSIRADVVKVVEDSTVYIRNGVYTTCPCVDDPSYSLRASTMKIVGRKWIFTGPIQLFLFNIPTPLWLPFGFLPAQEGRRSGPLSPSYGEDEFGFYLRGFGWYFALNDYMDLQMQGSLWTRGSFEIEALSRYRQRYGLSGQLQLSYGRFRNGEKGDPDFSVRNTGALRWTHQQPISPTANFDADVNLSSSGYLRAVSQDYDDRTRQTIQSSIRYSKRWSSRSLTLNANQRQIVETGSATLTLPTVSFTQNSFKPFQRGRRAPGAREAFYEKVTVSYSFTADNRYNFTRLADDALLAAGDTAATTISWIDALLSQDDYRRATGDDERFDFKASHRIPISAPFSVERLPLIGAFRVNLSPTLSYTEDWYLQSERRDLVTEDGVSKVDVRSVPGFVPVRQFTGSFSASTVFYGLFPVSIGKYRGIRHTVRPSLGFGWRPDFQSERWGYTRTYEDANGNVVTYPIVTGIGGGEQRSLTFSLNNTFETKRVPSDSTGAGTGSGAAAAQVVKLLDFGLASSYNYAADSLGFGTISLTGRTRLFGQVDVDFRSSYSPYQVNEQGRPVDRYAFSAGSPFGRLTNASLTVRTSLRSSTGGGSLSRPLETNRATYGGFGAGDAMGSMNGRDFGTSDPMYDTARAFGTGQTDFSIPWSLGLDLTYGIIRSGLTDSRRAILNATFDFSLTPNWKLSGRTGYDFERNEAATTNIAIARDFDCWQMSVNWIPFGLYQSYGFDLRVKSGKLAELLRLRQPRSDVSGRFGSLSR